MLLGEKFVYVSSAFLVLIVWSVGNLKKMFLFKVFHENINVCIHY